MGAAEQAREPDGPSCHGPCVRNGRASPARGLRTTFDDWMDQGIGRMRSMAIVLIATTCLAGCATTTVRAYRERSLAREPIVAGDGSRTHRTGHLLVYGAGDVLEVYRYDPGNPLAVDDEGCSFVLVELPVDTVGALPRPVDSPRAFLHTCSCVWGNCTEEEPLAGDVLVRQVSDLGIRATVDLRFPSRRVRRAGLFLFARPEAWKMARTWQDGPE